MELKNQGELFPLGQVKKAHSCRDCVRFKEDPYWRCEIKPGILLTRLDPCKQYIFNDEQSSFVFNALQSKQMSNYINNK